MHSFQNDDGKEVYLEVHLDRKSDAGRCPWKDVSVLDLFGAVLMLRFGFRVCIGQSSVLYSRNSD